MKQLARIAAVGAAGLALTAAGGAIAARASGVSVQGWIAAKLVVPFIFRDAGGADGLPRRIAGDRARGPALPPPEVTTRFRFEDRRTDGDRAFRLAPLGQARPLHILYFHGGAYVFGLREAHWTILAGLVERTGGVVVALLYPLAPEQDWRAGLAAAERAYAREVAEVGAGNVILAGDSAGGGLALALAHRLRDTDKPLPAGLVLFAPWLDATVGGRDQPELAKRDWILSIDMLREAGRLWAGAQPPSHPAVSPLLGDHRGLPPAMLFVGGDDLLLSDARRLARVYPGLELREYPAMFHVWMAAPIPEGRRALDEAAAFMKARARATASSWNPASPAGRTRRE